jgi:predicted nucleic acid-binding protein
MRESTDSRLEFRYARQVVSSAEDAHSLADRTGHTVYDCLYVALAVRLNTQAITADDRLETGLRRFPAVARHIQLVQTFDRS